MTLDNRHKIARPYWARPGFALFAKRADDNDPGADEGEDEEDDEDADEDEEDDEDADKSEDDLRAELKAVRASLGKAKGSSKRNLRRRRELEAELAKRSPAPRKPKGDDEEEEELDVESIREQARREGEKAGNDRVKRAELRTALARAGVRDEAALKRLAAGVNLDDLDLDDEGNVDGLDDVIDDLKADLPALFEKPRRRRQSVSGENDRNGDRAARQAPKTASERQAAALLRRSGD